MNRRQLLGPTRALTVFALAVCLFAGVARAQECVTCWTAKCGEAARSYFPACKPGEAKAKAPTSTVKAPPAPMKPRGKYDDVLEKLQQLANVSDGAARETRFSANHAASIANSLGKYHAGTQEAKEATKARDSAVRAADLAEQTTKAQQQDLQEATPEAFRKFGTARFLTAAQEATDKTQALEKEARAARTNAERAAQMARVREATLRTRLQQEEPHGE